MTKFCDKVKRLIREKGISIFRFEVDTGIHRVFFYRKEYHKPRRTTIMAIAYYLGMTAEELVADTDAVDAWYS